MATDTKQIVFSKPVDGALWAYSRGYKVFPVKPDEKSPAVMNWQDWAKNADNKKVKDFGTANPLFNWGIYCGESNLAVVDIDDKNGKKGSKTLADAISASKEPLPRTITVLTPNNGYHYYYEGMAKSKSDILGPGVDLKSQGGYVLCPGSRIGDKSYEISEDMDHIPTLPEWVVSNKPKKEVKESVGADALKGIELNQDHHIKAAIQYIVNEAPESVEGDHGNETLYIVAAQIKNLGIADLQTAKRIMAEHYDIKCYPSWLTDPLYLDQWHKTIESAYKGSQDPAGSKSIEAKQMEAEKEFRLAVEGFRYHKAIDFKQEDIKPRAWILGNRYIRGFVSVLIAPGGVGKSSLTLNEAAAITLNNNDMAGADVHEQGTVWMHSTEDPIDEMERKIYGFCLHNKIERHTLKNLIYTSSREHDLIIASESNEFKGKIIPHKINIQLIKDTILKEKVSLFIVDPFVRAHSISENDNAKIDQVVKIFSNLATETNCAISLVHHSPKQSNAKSSFRGNMDMARGASSLISAARVANTLDVMNEDEAMSFGISPTNKWRYIRLDNAKANLSAPSTKALWFEKVSVDLPHLKDAPGPQSIGILQPISMQLAEDTSEIQEVINEIMGSVPEKSVRSIAQALLDGPEEKALLFTKTSKVPNISTIRKGLTLRLKELEVFDDFRYYLVATKCEISGKNKFVLREKGEL